jgi:hypothetical protein
LRILKESKVLNAEKSGEQFVPVDIAEIHPHAQGRSVPNHETRVELPLIREKFIHLKG